MRCDEPGSWQGQCCCNCKWQLPLVKHPWNKIELFKGSVMDQIAWVCIVPDMEAAMVSDRGHGMCEMHDYK
mgnify:CR=1 FL=1